ncbi:MAG: hypothetical protein R3280_10580, partial [Marinobacter sp.]|uniref:hypothetical protein n=1 Tax=Marinobacter sp. TaxID=50741 RepID=UPI00299DD482
MRTLRFPLLAVAVASVGLTGCLESGGQGNKNADTNYQITSPQIKKGTSPVFSPLDTAFPIPSDPLFFLSTVDDGTMLDGSDPANPVTTGLGFMDGNSVLAPIDIKISASIDPNQPLDARSFIREGGEPDGAIIPNPDQNIFFFPLAFPGGDSLKQVQGEVAGVPLVNQYQRAQRLLEEDPNSAEAQAILTELIEQQRDFRIELIDIDGGVNNAIRILPIKPLAPKTKYAVVLSNDIVDAQGEPLVGAVTYQSVADPARVLSNPAFQPFRDAMLPPRQLAADVQSFKEEVLARNDLAGFEDIVFSVTVTTTAIDDVLLANAAPVTFFGTDLRVQARQAAVERLIEGFYNLSNQPLTDTTDQEAQAINDEIFRLLTDPSFRLYDPELAEILTMARDSRTRLTYADVARNGDGSVNRPLGFVLQTAASEAALTVRSGSLDTQAGELASAAESLLDTPKPRDVRIYRQRDANEINPALQASVSGVTVTPRVFEGEITLPYYQNLPDFEAMNGRPIQTSNWLTENFGPNVELPLAPSDRITYRFPFAMKKADTKVPLLITVPDDNAASPGQPADGYPVIIYQHAVTQDRSGTLPFATGTSLTCIDPNNNFDCYVTIAVDQPLHGIFGTSAVGLEEIQPSDDPGTASPDATERHFGFAADENLLAQPAEVLEVAESGSLFLNFANYANTRDNMRQGTLDLLNLNASLAAINQAFADFGSGVRINPNRVYFMNHSLSGMGGVPFTYVNNQALDAGNSNLNRVLASNFLNTGGQFTRLFENSVGLAPQLLPGLAAASPLLQQGRTELNIYFNVFQALLDTADPSTFAQFYRETPTLLTEIVGTDGNPDLKPDQTIPNAADAELYELGALELTVPETGFVIDSEPAPLAGTEPLATEMGALATADSGEQSVLPAITRYTEGTHGNPISAGQQGPDPGSSSAVFTEMVSQALQLFTSGTV